MWSMPHKLDADTRKAPLPHQIRKQDNALLAREKLRNDKERGVCRFLDVEAEESQEEELEDTEEEEELQCTKKTVLESEESDEYEFVVTGAVVDSDDDISCKRKKQKKQKIAASSSGLNHIVPGRSIPWTDPTKISTPCEKKTTIEVITPDKGCSIVSDVPLKSQTAVPAVNGEGGAVRKKIHNPYYTKRTSALAMKSSSKDASAKAQSAMPASNQVIATGKKIHNPYATTKMSVSSGPHHRSISHSKLAEENPANLQIIYASGKPVASFYQHESKRPSSSINWSSFLGLGTKQARPINSAFVSSFYDPEIQQSPKPLTSSLVPLSIVEKYTAKATDRSSRAVPSGPTLETSTQREMEELEAELPDSLLVQIFDECYNSRIKKSCPCNEKHNK